MTPFDRWIAVLWILCTINALLLLVVDPRWVIYSSLVVLALHFWAGLYWIGQ